MEVVDITLIGSGTAATVTLIEVLNKSLNSPKGSSKLNIAVIEKKGEYWKGIPYGSRSSINALTITSVYDFLYEPERPVFFEWLKKNLHNWTSYYSKHGGLIAKRWLDKNLPLIEKNEWEAVYVPRFLFGNYLSEKLTGLLKSAEEKQFVKFKLVHAEAIDVKLTADGLHEVVVEYPDRSLSNIFTRKLVIATGSAPVRKMCEVADYNVVYVNDIYEPSVNENIEKLISALSKTDIAEDRNVLFIGSNASSIELLYLIEGMPELRALINKVIIISTSGALPHPTSTEILADHPMPNLDKVKAAGNYNVETLVDAAASDIELAMQGGAKMDYVATIIGNTLKMLECLGEEAKKLFFAIYAIRLRDKFRRAGSEYRTAAQALIDLNEVAMLKGRFINVVPTEKGVLLNYKDTATSQLQTYPLNFKAIINCSGSDDLHESSSRLLYNIVNNQICQMNLSKKGIEVNEKFEAAPNLYIMGPLLGGNVNKLIHFWQLENASRLTYLAPYLAEELLNS